MSSPMLDPDDPRLTAYALGELDDADRAVIEHLLERSPEARAVVADIRALAGDLSGELAREPVPASVTLALTTAPTATRRRYSMLAVATSAAVMLAAVWAVTRLPRVPDNSQEAWLSEGRLRSRSATGLGEVAAPTDEFAQLHDADVSGSHLAYSGLAGANGERRPELFGTEPAPVTPPATTAPAGPTAARHDGTTHFYLKAGDDARKEVFDVQAQPMKRLAAQPGVAGKPVQDAERQVRLAIPAPQAEQPSHDYDDASRGVQRESLGQSRRSLGAAVNGPNGLTTVLESEAKGVRFLAEQEKRGGHEWRYEDRLLKQRDRAEGESAESYETIVENPFVSPLSAPLSTFSIDVDTASYSNVRRYLKSGQLPPKNAVRIEELINYFDYSYPPPDGDVPFAVRTEIAACPWDAEHRLVRIGLKGREVSREDRPPTNLVFLIDVSGSMQPPNKLPLVKAALEMLVEGTTERDRVAMVVYAGNAGLVLESTPGSRQPEILSAIERLDAGGSTNGAEGIQLAYQQARQQFLKDGVNRVILCTDGDFNVGISSDDALVELIQREAKSGVFLSVFGFGMGNLKDSKLEKLADKGNGHYAYIDDRNEARKVFVEELSGTLVTIAKDVKIQVEFNPAQVGAYRLIGYENRALADRDFNDDTKDAGEIGAGHTVTALYEIIPADKAPEVVAQEALKYQRRIVREKKTRDEVLTLKLRYKQPDGDKSTLVEYPAVDERDAKKRPSNDFQWAAAVAAFGLVLRDSQFQGSANLPLVMELAQASRGSDSTGRRQEFLELVQTAEQLRQRETRLKAAN